jgi:hypothetical protein
MIATKPVKQKSVPQLLKVLQVVFNAYIRKRDAEKGCISCGSPVTEAGHYFSAGHYSSYRFTEINVNGQCTRCNCFLSGNLIKYRQGLVKRYGEAKVLMLENDAAIRKAKKWSRFELEILIKEYKQKVKA